jgi:hypothetical protein
MRSTRIWTLVFVFLAMGMMAASAYGQGSDLCSTVRPPTVCPNPAKPAGQPCSDLPHDVNFKLLKNVGYETLLPVCQQPFDDFSWQSFVALNWPLSSLANPRPWETYIDPDEIFNGLQLKKMRATTAAEAKLTAAQAAKVKILYKMAKRHALPGETFTQFLQATLQPLIDRNLNFALYEERVNSVWATYVTSGACKNMNPPTPCLNTNAGQQAFINKGNSVTFPVGFYKDEVHGTGGALGAMEIKAAWRILDPKKGDKLDRYYTRVADIYMDPDHTVNHQPLVVKGVVIGLVGFHINTYTTDGKGSVWSTFEQEDNAPPQGKPVPGTTYSFFNAACTSCALNTAPALIDGEKNYLWGTTAPYAQRYATNGQYGTQVTIVNAFYPPTEATNERWHKLMPSTVWTHYRLIGTQWTNGEVPKQGIPQFLANSTLETYVPQQSSSCINCHASFATLNPPPNPPADLSFLLSHAH